MAMEGVDALLASKLMALDAYVTKAKREAETILVYLKDKDSVAQEYFQRIENVHAVCNTLDNYMVDIASGVVEASMTDHEASHHTRKRKTFADDVAKDLGWED
jgi:hypothetical protein